MWKDPGGRWGERTIPQQSPRSRNLFRASCLMGISCFPQLACLPILTIYHQNSNWASCSKSKALKSPLIGIQRFLLIPPYPICLQRSCPTGFFCSSNRPSSSLTLGLCTWHFSAWITRPQTWAWPIKTSHDNFSLNLLSLIQTSISHNYFLHSAYHRLKLTCSFIGVLYYVLWPSRPPRTEQAPLSALLTTTSPPTRTQQGHN